MAKTIEDVRRERDLARSRISRATSALESGRPEDALTVLKGEGLCDYNRCASLTAAHRLLERWIFHARGIDVKDPLVEYDTESFLGRDIFNLRCPRCDEPLQLTCPLPRCVEAPPSEARIKRHVDRYAGGLAPMMFSCVACDSPLCIACPSCGREPVDRALEKEKS